MSVKASDTKARVGGHLKGLFGIVAISALVISAFVATRSRHWVSEGRTPPRRVAALAAKVYGLRVRASDVWIPTAARKGIGSGLDYHHVLFLGSRGAAARDLYWLKVRFSPTGIPLHSKSLNNLSKTPHLDESVVAVTRSSRGGALAAYVVGNPEQASVVHVVDTSGEDPRLTASWPWIHRTTARITNWQETGQFAGLDRQILEMSGAVAGAKLRFTENGLLKLTGSGNGKQKLFALYNPDARTLVAGLNWVRHERVQRGRRPLFNWVVDTVRNFSFVGPKKIEMLEVAVFTARDLVRRGYLWLRYGGRPPLSARDKEAGTAVALEGSEYRPQPGVLKPPDWPPPPIKPVVSSPDPKEGKWMAVRRDLISRNPSAPEPVLETFVHPDPKRPYSAVGIFVWDPRQVNLGLAAGTREPRSTRGRRGKGRIPRDERMTRLIAAFNGGFQTLHGEFGMQVDGRLIREPTRWAATVATLRDGTLAFGAWEPKGRSVPENIRSFRQNLAPLVEDGRENPLGSKYWGWSVRSQREKVHIVRAAICLTREGFGAFLWGKAVSLKSLTKAMKMARCQFGMQLDINYTNASLELYKVRPVASIHPRPPRRFKVGRSRSVTAVVPGRSDLAFSARSWLPGMHLKPFPRYIRTDWRDFMYLYLRNILPGPPLATRVKPSLPGEGRWLTRGLDPGPKPFPARIAMTFIRPDPGKPEARVEVVKLAPDRLAFAARVTGGNTAARASAPPVAELRFGRTVPPGLKLGKSRFSNTQSAGLSVVVGRTSKHGSTRAAVVSAAAAGTRTPAPDLIVSGPACNAAVSREPEGEQPTAARLRVSALGADANGFLCYAVTDARHGSALCSALAMAGCKNAIRLPDRPRRGPLVLRPRGRRARLLPGDAGSAGQAGVILSLLPVSRPHAVRLFKGAAGRPRRVKFAPSKQAIFRLKLRLRLEKMGISHKTPEGKALMQKWLDEAKAKSREERLKRKARRNGP